MYFRDIVGQEETVRRLRQMVREGRVPHALMIDGPEGCGALPIALALARYLCCTGEKGEDACGHCPSCVKFDRLAHPDLHFVFPIFKPDSNKKWVCDDFVQPWRAMNLKNPYFSFSEWMASLGTDKQGMIYADEGDEIFRKLMLKSYESVYKVMIVWLPEKMHPNCSNHLLKILEEPPANTIFLLVTENSESVLGTIYSRSQHLRLHGIDVPSMTGALQRAFPAMEVSDLTANARLSKGNMVRARELCLSSEQSGEMLRQFVRCMRGAYMIANFSRAKRLEKQEALIDLKKWSEEMAKCKREMQKEFLAYAQRMIRENFILHYGQPSINYLNPSEEDFSSRFFPYIHAGNIEDFMKEFEVAEKQIEQNTASKMVFFDLALKCILLLKR